MAPERIARRDRRLELDTGARARIGAEGAELYAESSVIIRFVGVREEADEELRLLVLLVLDILEYQITLGCLVYLRESNPRRVAP